MIPFFHNTPATALLGLLPKRINWESLAHPAVAEHASKLMLFLAKNVSCILAPHLSLQKKTKKTKKNPSELLLTYEPTLPSQ